MFKGKNKMIASVLALTVVAANMTSLSVNAATIPTINTNFEYELKAEIVSQSQIKLTFYTTVNPGINQLGLALVYDPEKFTAIDSGIDSDFCSSVVSVDENNPQTGVYIFAAAVKANAITGLDRDYDENFYVSLYLNAKDGDAMDEELCEFSAAVVDYKSLSENIEMETRLTGDSGNLYVPEENPPEITIEELTYTHNYMVGDADSDGCITLSDVTLISRLATVANAVGVSNTVDNLNDLISNHVVSTYSGGKTFDWAGNFSNLFITPEGLDFTFTCIESCDATQDGAVKQEDADEVADCYAALASNVPIADIFKTPMIKTIYI